MRVFKSKPFHRYARKVGLDDAALRTAAQEVADGLVEADLGSGVFKKRIARPGGGKSSGFRTLLFCVHDDITIFQFGFAKNERDNISEKELEVLKKAARVYAQMSIAQMAASTELIEIEEQQ